MQRNKLMWKALRIVKKIVRYGRGGIVRCLYDSGKKLSIMSGCTFDAENIEFGEDVHICSNVRIFGKGHLRIGNNVAIGDGTVICVAEEICIDDDTMIAAHCYITDCNHGTHQGDLMRLQPLRIKPVCIGKNVWIGCSCNILSGAKIGDGTVVGAGTVVTECLGKDSFVIPERRYTIVERV